MIRIFRPRGQCFLAGLGLLLLGAAGSEQSSAEEPDLAEESVGGDPRISGVWGDRTDGSPVSILGSGFGSHTMDIESSLGPRGWIEANPLGTPIDRVAGVPEWTTFATRVAPYVDDTRVHSGSRAVNASVDRGADGDWQKVLHYTHPDRFASIYATWWVYFEPVKYADRTQWKMWRVSDDGGHVTVSDNCGSPYQNSYWSRGADPVEYVTIFHCAKGCAWPAAKACTANIVPEPWYAPRYNDPFQYRYHNRGETENYAVNLPVPGVWCRAEFFLMGSDVGKSNGKYWLSINRPGEKRKIIDNWVDGLLTRGADCCADESEQWKHFVLQGFWDDNGGDFQDEEAGIFYDDIYLQFGTTARVELGNAPIFDDCTQLEVQEVTQWSGKDIRITLNHGAFSGAAVVWLFVVRGDGVVSPGMPTRLN